MASNTYIAPFYSSLGCSSRPLFAANMLGLRSLCNRAITASRAKVKAPNRISSCKFEGVPQAFHRICSPSFRLPQQYTRSSIRSYSKDSVLVPAKSIEGFGGPTDEVRPFLCLYSSTSPSFCAKTNYLTSITQFIYLVRSKLIY